MGKNQRLNAAVNVRGNREVHSLVSENFYPLTYFREPEDLICGTLPIKEKTIKRGIKYPWDLIANLKEDMEEDFQSSKFKTQSSNIHKSAVLINKKAIHVGKDTAIGACAVLDATNGPIYIGEKTIIHPQTLLRGPLYIGNNCKIGGEVVHCIIMDCVNKSHYGFLGHSYICPWVNLGAGTTNSNLKNNYSSVKVYLNGQMIDTGETFMGCFIGDHTKTAIGTMIYTGCVIGVAANLFGEPYYKKFVPSFSWGVKEIYKAEDAIETAKIMMSRRNVKLTSQDEALFKKVFELTKSERV